MFAVLVALVLLFAGVAAIYFLLKKMSEEGIDIAAPGSCKRGRCGVPSRPLVEEAPSRLRMWVIRKNRIPEMAAFGHRRQTAIKSHSGFFSKPAIDPAPLPESRRWSGGTNFQGL